MNSPKVDSTSRCVEYNCFNKTASTIAIALSTIILIGGILALLASTGYDLAALNVLSEMEIMGSCLTIGFGTGFTLFSLGWIVAMVRNNSAKRAHSTLPTTPEVEVPLTVRTINLDEPAVDFIFKKNYLVFATQSGVNIVVSTKVKQQLFNQPIHEIGSNFFFHRGSPETGTNSFIQFNPEPEDNFALPGATTVAESPDDRIYVGQADGTILSANSLEELQSSPCSEQITKSPISKILPTSIGVFAISEEGMLFVKKGDNEEFVYIRKFKNVTCMAADNECLYMGTETNLYALNLETEEIVQTADYGITAIAASEQHAIGVCTTTFGRLVIRSTDKKYNREIDLKPYGFAAKKLLIHEMKIYALIQDKIIVFDLNEIARANTISEK